MFQEHQRHITWVRIQEQCIRMDDTDHLPGVAPGIWSPCFQPEVFLILDNFSGHTPVKKIPDHIRLRNTTILYLPPNMTSKIQPCDAGIIRNFKAYHRRRFNRAFLQRIEDKVPEPKKVNILGAIQFAVPAWNYEVKPTTIANCFLHYKIRLIEQAEAVENVTKDDLVDHEVIVDL